MGQPRILFTDLPTGSYPDDDVAIISGKVFRAHPRVSSAHDERAEPA